MKTSVMEVSRPGLVSVLVSDDSVSVSVSVSVSDDEAETPSLILGVCFQDKMLQFLQNVSYPMYVILFAGI